METQNKTPKCHFKEMKQVSADDGYTSVEFLECSYYGHTKDY